MRLIVVHRRHHPVLDVGADLLGMAQLLVDIRIDGAKGLHEQVEVGLVRRDAPLHLRLLDLLVEGHREPGESVRLDLLAENVWNDPG
jgi:hypothetical protein